MLNNSNIKTQEVIKNLELAVKSLMNKNAVIYSNRSKSTESLSNGSCSLTINTLNKSFVFSYGTPCLGPSRVFGSSSLGRSPWTVRINFQQLFRNKGFAQGSSSQVP